MFHSLRKTVSILCVSVLILTIMANIIQPAAAKESASDVLYPSVSAWKTDCSWFSNSSMRIEDDMIVLQNNGGNHYVLAQTVPVKPNTSYRFRAQVRVENYEPTEGQESGASVRAGGAYDSSSYNNDYVTSSDWQTSSMLFTSGDQDSMKISIALGCWGAACKGTAYFKDMVLEELETNNHWNVLALIYTDADTPDYWNYFSDEEVDELRNMLGAYPAAVKNLSDGRMLIDQVDIKIIDTPVESISGGSGDLTAGENGDINFDAFLEGKDYQLIVVYAPLSGAPTNNGWLGLGGSWYDYHGQQIYYLIINDVLDIGRRNYYVRGEYYDADTSCLLHETLHCVETNSSYFRGWSGFTPVHNNADHGYVTDAEYGWLDWYSALMRDDGLDGKGFRPESFLVRHLPVEQEFLPSEISAAESTAILTGSVEKLEVQILPEGTGARTALTAASTSPEIADVVSRTVIADENGKAVIMLKGLKPGSCQVNISLDGTDLTASVQVKVTAENELAAGDVNTDGRVNSADVNLLYRYVMGYASLGSAQIQAGEVNGDSTVNSADVNLLYRFVMGYIDSLK